MAYEDKMNVGYDEASRILLVRFRGKEQKIPMPEGMSRSDAIKYGEQICRDSGWKG